MPSIFSQVVACFSPLCLVTGDEQGVGRCHIRELVPGGAPVNRWTGMITVPGLQGAASVAQRTPPGARRPLRRASRRSARAPSMPCGCSATARMLLRRPCSVAAPTRGCGTLAAKPPRSLPCGAGRIFTSCNEPSAAHRPTSDSRSTDPVGSSGSIDGIRSRGAPRGPDRRTGVSRPARGNVTRMTRGALRKPLP